jgi:hypothetical protein
MMVQLTMILLYPYTFLHPHPTHIFFFRLSHIASLRFTELSHILPSSMEIEADVLQGFLKVVIPPRICR